MKSFVSALAAVVVLVIVLGFSALKVLKQEAQNSVNDLLPTEFRQKVSLQQIADHRAEMAQVAATIDRDRLPRYEAFLPGATYSGLRDANFQPFRDLVSDLKEGSAKLSKSSDPCCGKEGMQSLAAKQKKVETLAAQAEEDLTLMETLAARVQGLNDLEASLTNAVTSLSLSNTPAQSSDPLEAVREFIVDCESRANEQRYETEFRCRMNGGMSDTETAELKALLQTLELASN
jgi:hypothetical protein